LSETRKQFDPANLTDVLDAWMRGGAIGINCIQIGIVQAFNSSNQTATVQIALKQVKEIAPDGTRTLVEYPLLLQCPVVVLYGGADFISMPITAGDNCLIFFNDREIDNWFSDGGVQAPTSGRVHDLSDGIALVGIRSLQNSILTYLANGIRLSHGAGATGTRIDLKDSLISSIATLFEHTGNMRIDGNLSVVGNMTGEGGGSGNLQIISDITQTPGRTLKAGNGATGVFNTVTVEDGIVTGGT